MQAGPGMLNPVIPGSRFSCFPGMMIIFPNILIVNNNRGFLKQKPTTEIRG